MKVSDILIGATVLSGLYLVFRMNGSKPSSAQLDRVYAMAMSPNMQKPSELEWASATLRSNGRVGQADAVDMKATAIKASPTPVVAPPGFVTGHTYTGRIQLSGIEATFASAGAVESAVRDQIGLPVKAENIGSGAWLITGVWTIQPMPYPLPLPDKVKWIRDDTTGEVTT